MVDLDSEGRAASTTGVLARAAAIIDAVEISPRSSAELARLLGLSTSTVYRLVGEMVRYSFLRRDEDGVIHPGGRYDSSALNDVARPVLDRLRDDTEETAQLWVPRGQHRLCTVSVDSRHILRAVGPVGTTLPLTLGSASHVLSGDVDSDPTARERGWWESSEERTIGLASVSAPVHKDGRIAAAICVAGPVQRIATSAGEMWGDAVVKAAREIERAVNL